jgi:hypothetical protein
MCELRISSPLCDRMNRYPMSDVIAEYALVGRAADGTTFPVQITLYRPIVSIEFAPAWECATGIAPWLNIAPIYGVDAFQSLCLAAKHIVQTLDTHVQHGGRLEYDDGAKFDPSVFGFQLVPHGT